MAGKTTIRDLQIAWLMPLLALYVLLLAAALLREYPCFWVAACGVPQWVRASLRYGFYPTLIGFTLLLLVLTWIVARSLPRQQRPVASLVNEPVASMWVTAASLFLVVVADNLFNVVIGLPITFDASMVCCC